MESSDKYFTSKENVEQEVRAENDPLLKNYMPDIFSLPVEKEQNPDLSEKIVDKKRYFTGVVYASEVLKVRLPDQTLGRREIVLHNGGATIVPLDKDFNVYMVRQYRTPFQELLLETPAGKLELGEDPRLCAIRELKEETGLRAGKIDYLGEIYPSPGYCSEILHLFLAQDLIQEQACLDEGEFLQVEKIPLSLLLEQIEKGEIKDGKTVISLLKVARRVGL